MTWRVDPVDPVAHGLFKSYGSYGDDHENPMVINGDLTNDLFMGFNGIYNGI